MAAILGAPTDLEDRVLSDLTSNGVRSDLGRDGLLAQQVLRLMVLDTMLGVTFEQLDFLLADSPTYCASCLLGSFDPPPKRACITSKIAKLRPQTLSALHSHIVRYAIERKLETVSVVQTDTTSVAAPIRAPLDSALLSDSVRVLSRLLKRAQKWIPTQMSSHYRCVTHRTTELRAPEVTKKDGEALYSELIDDTKRYVEAALFAATYLEGIDDPNAYFLSIDLRASAEHARCVVDQTERRVFDEECSLLRTNWCRFSSLTQTFSASETVSWMVTKCVCRLGGRDLSFPQKCSGGNPAVSTLVVSAIAPPATNHQSRPPPCFHKQPSFRPPAPQAQAPPPQVDA